MKTNPNIEDCFLDYEYHKYLVDEAVKEKLTEIINQVNMGLNSQLIKKNCETELRQLETKLRRN